MLNALVTPRTAPQHLLSSQHPTLARMLDTRLALLRDGIIQIPNGLFGVIHFQFRERLVNTQPSVIAGELASLAQAAALCCEHLSNTQANLAKLALEDMPTLVEAAGAKRFIPTGAATSHVELIFAMIILAQTGTHTLSRVQRVMLSAIAAVAGPTSTLTTALTVGTSDSLETDIKAVATSTEWSLMLAFLARAAKLAGSYASASAPRDWEQRQKVLERIAALLALIALAPKLAERAFVLQLMAAPMFDQYSKELVSSRTKERWEMELKWITALLGADYVNELRFGHQSPVTHGVSSSTMNLFPQGLYDEMIATPIFAAAGLKSPAKSGFGRDVLGYFTTAEKTAAVQDVDPTGQVDPTIIPLATMGPEAGDGILESCFSALLARLQAAEISSWNANLVGLLSVAGSSLPAGAAEAADALRLTPIGRPQPTLTAEPRSLPILTSGATAEANITTAAELLSYRLLPASLGAFDYRYLCRFIVGRGSCLRARAEVLLRREAFVTTDKPKAILPFERSPIAMEFPRTTLNLPVWELTSDRYAMPDALTAPRSFQGLITLWGMTAVEVSERLQSAIANLDGVNEPSGLSALARALSGVGLLFVTKDSEPSLLFDAAMRQTALGGLAASGDAKAFADSVGGLSTLADSALEWFGVAPNAAQWNLFARMCGYDIEGMNKGRPSQSRLAEAEPFILDPNRRGDYHLALLPFVAVPSPADLLTPRLVSGLTADLSGSTTLLQGLGVSPAFEAPLTAAHAFAYAAGVDRRSYGWISTQPLRAFGDEFVLGARSYETGGRRLYQFTSVDANDVLVVSEGTMGATAAPVRLRGRTAAQAVASDPTIDKTGDPSLMVDQPMGY